MNKMPLPEFSVRHVATRDDLPETLVQGRAYFIEDEGTITVNHGDGGIDYGAAVTANSTAQAVGDISNLVTPVTSNLTSAVNSIHNYTNGWYEMNHPQDNMGNFYIRKFQYRGSKNLGETVTDEQWNEIRNHTYNDIYLGDYWEREITYENHTGTEVTKTLRFYIISIRSESLVVWTPTPLFSMPFWDDNTAGNMYYTSYIRTQAHSKIGDAVKTFFGSSHINSGGSSEPPYSLNGTIITTKILAGTWGIPSFRHLFPYVHWNAIRNLNIRWENAKGTIREGSYYVWDWPLLTPVIISGLFTNRNPGCWLQDPTENGTYAVSVRNAYYDFLLSNGKGNGDVCPWTYIYP